jgi:hypothetical protein
MARDLLAVMLYPSVLVALFETFRYPYWGTPRAFVWLLGAALVLLTLWLCGVVTTQADHPDRRFQATSARRRARRTKGENIRAASV